MSAQASADSQHAKAPTPEKSKFSLVILFDAKGHNTPSNRPKNPEHPSTMLLCDRTHQHSTICPVGAGLPTATAQHHRT